MGKADIASDEAIIVKGGRSFDKSKGEQAKDPQNERVLCLLKRDSTASYEFETHCEYGIYTYSYVIRLINLRYRCRAMITGNIKGERKMDFRDTSTHSITPSEDDFVRSGAFYTRSGSQTRDRLEQMKTVRNQTGEPNNLILRSLPAAVHGMLEPFMKTVTLAKEQFIYQEDGRLDHLYFPVTAVVSEFKILEDGRMVEIAVIGREGAIGLSSMFSASHLAPNCTQVTQAGTAKRIDAANFEKALRSSPELREALIKYVDPYIRQISQKAICNMYHSVKERLCTWLLMVQDRCGRSTLNLTHEQIARTLGVYRPSITCIAQELREKGLIDYSRGGISISDRDRVEEAACTCYMELTNTPQGH